MVTAESPQCRKSAIEKLYLEYHVARGAYTQQGGAEYKCNAR